MQNEFKFYWQSSREVRCNQDPVLGGFVLTLTCVEHNTIIYIYVCVCVWMSTYTLSQSFLETWTYTLHVFIYSSVRVYCKETGCERQTSLYSLSSQTFTARSREVSKPGDWPLWWAYRSEIGQASQPCFCREACPISERFEKSKAESRCFKTSRDLSVRRQSAKQAEAQYLICHAILPWRVTSGYSTRDEGSKWWWR